MNRDSQEFLNKLATDQALEQSIAGIKNLAIMTGTMYQESQKAGFSENQAFILAHDFCLTITNGMMQVERQYVEDDEHE